MKGWWTRTVPVGTVSTIGLSELTRFDSPLDLAGFVEITRPTR
jgi:hypothetical protein